MKWTQLLKNEPCDVPEKQSDDVVAVSQIVELDGGKVLNIDLFLEGELKGRYFADENVYNAYVNGKWHACKIDNVARLCKGKEALKNDYYYGYGEWEWASGQDKERALDFLGTYRVENYEAGVNAFKKEKAAIRKGKRINDMMAEIPCVPDEAEEWIKEKVFPGNILFVKKEGGQTAYSCTACGAHGLEKTEWKHDKKTVCPKCGQEVTVNSRKQEKEKREPIVILQIFGQQWVERQFRGVCRWSADGKELFLYEECRAIIPKGECWGKVWYGIDREADEFEQDFWDKNPQNKRFLSSYLWPGNLQEVLAYGNLEKSGLNLLAESVTKLNVNKYITTFHQRPWMEYLVKAGLNRLAADIVNKYGWYGDPSAICTTAETLKEALRLDGNRTHRIKQINGGLRTLEWLQYETEQGIKISQETLHYLSDKDVCMRDCEDILKELKSVNRMANYMKKQRVAPNKLTTTWRDYLRMARNEGMDTTDDIVRFPKDLKARHDQLVELINARRDAEELKKNQEKYAGMDKKILEHLPEVKKYFWEDENYMIIPAGKCEELIAEGRALHHCVGASDIYMNKMTEGRTWICFLRKKENLEKSYYTLEIDMKSHAILQAYSEFDRKPDKTTVDNILARFKNSVKRKCEKELMKTQIEGALQLLAAAG